MSWRRQTTQVVHALTEEKTTDLRTEVNRVKKALWSGFGAVYNQFEREAKSK